MQCALTIVKKLHNLDTGGNNKLSVKIGLGAGDCCILYVGGTFGRAEFCSVGQAMIDACSSECHCTAGGQIVLCKSFKELLFRDGEEELYNFDICEKDPSHPDADYTEFYKFRSIKSGKTVNPEKAKADAFLLRSKLKNDQLTKKIRELQNFVPKAVVNYLDIEKENWCKELRILTVMFCNLPIYLKDLDDKDNEIISNNDSYNNSDNSIKGKGIDKIKEIIKLAQRCAYCTRGSVNKFLMDEKGSNIILCWGLPPFSSYDDSVRAVFSGLLLINKLKELDCLGKNDIPKIGISVGTCFCGTCGSSGDRREYTTLGDIVNLSARLMQSMIMSYLPKEKNLKTTLHDLIDLNTGTGKIKNSIFLSEATRASILNKIGCDFIVNAGLKGFSTLYRHYSPQDLNLNEYIPNGIKLHHNSFELPKDDKEINLKEGEFIKCHKSINKLISLYESSKNGSAVLIKGNLGTGKSALVKEFVKYMSNKNKNLKDGVTYFVSNPNPVSHIQSMFGFNLIFRAMIKQLRKLKEFENNRIDCGNGLKGDIFFRYILQSNLIAYLRFIDDILGEEQKIKNNENDNLKELVYAVESEDILGDLFFSERYYKLFRTERQKQNNEKSDTIKRKRNLDEIEKKKEDKEQEDVREKICSFFFYLINTYQKYICKDTTLILIIEDSQKLDLISHTFIRKFVEKICVKSDDIKNIMLICNYQTFFIEKMNIEDMTYKERNNNLNELFNVHIQEINKFDENNKYVYDNEHSKNIDIINIEQLTNFEDIEKLICQNIRKVYKSANEIAEIRKICEKRWAIEKPKLSKDEQDANEYDIENPNPDDMVIDANITKIDKKLLKCLISISNGTNPLFLIENFQCLLNQNYIELIEKQAFASQKLLDMWQTHDFSAMDIPIIIEKVLGQIVDIYDCTEIIILKHASCIGNFFDVQLLSKIVNIPNMSFDDLMNKLRSFEKDGIMDFLYDKKPKRAIVVFRIPLLREVIYHRLLKEQKTEIHGKIAQNMQYAKFSYFSPEEEKRILENHIRISEITMVSELNKKSKKNKNKNEENEENRNENENNLKILTIREIVENLKIIELKVSAFDSNKFVDEQRPKFFEVNNPILIEGDSMRLHYAILSHDKVCIYSDKKKYYPKRTEKSNENQNLNLPDVEFELKNIYQIVKKDSEKDIYNQIKISVSSYHIWDYQKKIQESRTGNKKYVLQFKVDNEKRNFYQWEIALNFLRIRNMYNEFTSNFGMLQFPIINDLGILNKQYKRKLVVNKKKGNKDDDKNQMESIYKKEHSLSIDAFRKLINYMFGMFIFEVKMGLNELSIQPKD